MANLLRKSVQNILTTNNSVLLIRQSAIAAITTDAKNELLEQIRNIKIDEERLNQIKESPSGWVPPSEKKPDLPFSIRRTKTNNLPVYSDIKGGGSLHITLIRKIRGDLMALELLLKENFGSDLIVQRNELTGQVKIKGYYKDKIITLLKQLGY